LSGMTSTKSTKNKSFSILLQIAHLSNW